MITKTKEIRGLVMLRVSLVVTLCLLVGCSNAPSKDGDPNNQQNNENNANNANNANNETTGNNVPSGSCDGAPPVPSGAMLCSSGEDCDGADVQCVYEADAVPGNNSGNLAPACGVACIAEVECESTEACEVEGELCRQWTNDQTCCGPIPGNMRCMPPCEVGECYTNERCEEDGHCRPIPCEDDGYDCPTSFVCDPERGGADQHGCALGLCDVDGIDCPSDHTCDPESQWADLRNCAPDRCEDGYECQDNFDCDANTPNHGCKQRACSTNADCDCGACADGQCWPRSFYCGIIYPQPG